MKITPNDKAKTLGLDYGGKRIGTAVSDDLFLTAQPLETINYKDPDEAIRIILNIIKEKKVARVVVGIPLSLSGEEGDKAAEVGEFVARLTPALEGLELKTWDERLTTVQAERIMIEGGASRARRRKKIDSLAAAIMLQSYIDYVNLRQSTKHETNK